MLESLKKLISGEELANAILKSFNNSKELEVGMIKESLCEFLKKQSIPESVIGEFLDNINGENGIVTINQINRLISNYPVKAIRIALSEKVIAMLTEG